MPTTPQQPTTKREDTPLDYAIYGPLSIIFYGGFWLIGLAAILALLGAFFMGVYLGR